MSKQIQYKSNIGITRFPFTSVYQSFLPFSNTLQPEKVYMILLLVPDILYYFSENFHCYKTAYIIIYYNDKTKTAVC